MIPALTIRFDFQIQFIMSTWFTVDENSPAYHFMAIIRKTSPFHFKKWRYNRKMSRPEIQEGKQKRSPFLESNIVLTLPSYDAIIQVLCLRGLVAHKTSTSSLLGATETTFHLSGKWKILTIDAWDNFDNTCKKSFSYFKERSQKSIKIVNPP